MPTATDDASGAAVPAATPFDPAAGARPVVRRLAVLGRPIGHSKSPQLHAAAYRAMGLDWDYSRLEVGPEELPRFVDSLDETWRGLSLTMPLKRTVIDVADEAGPLVTMTGTANTLLLSADGKRRAFNTDVPGFVGALGAAGVTALGTVLILGSGATAACALCAVARLGAGRVDVATRTPEHAAWLAPLAEGLGVTLAVHPMRLADRTLQVPDLVVSTLPGGVRPDVLITASTRRQALLFDVSYDPWPSPLAAAWQEVHGRVLSGFALLVHQALVQVRVFTAGDPETPLAGEDRVLRAMLDAVGLDEAGWGPGGPTAEG
ncbi:MAG TPA: shikimate dehydrogenase [Microbacteriaceae bacterium]|nr:shikimate dehydrogenase [Microbacteriaceae bacterium]